MTNSPRFIVVKVTLTAREDGGLRVSSSDLPGLILSGGDKRTVFAAIGPAIEELLTLKGITVRGVECALTPEEVLTKDTPCDIDMHVSSVSALPHEEAFVVELAHAA